MHIIKSVWLEMPTMQKREEIVRNMAIQIVFIKSIQTFCELDIPFGMDTRIDHYKTGEAEGIKEQLFAEQHLHS